MIFFFQSFISIIIHRRFSDKPNASWWGSASYDLETLVCDLREVVTVLGYSKCVLVSHDWGGLLAWQFTARYPQMVSHLVTMAMPHPACWKANFNLAQFASSWYIAFFQVPWLPELYATRRNYHMTRRGVFTGKQMGCKRAGAVTQSDLDVYLWASASPGTTSAAINYYRNLFTRNLLFGQVSPFPSTPLQVPVLSIIPDCDNAILKSTYRNQAMHVANLTELRLTSKCTKVHSALWSNGAQTNTPTPRVHGADSSHWVMMDAPREVVASMCDFLQVPLASRPKLKDISAVPAEPCTRACFLNGQLEMGSTDTPLTLEELESSETSRHAGK
jgi:pimeloyl-ACP methyl ester carboxylesterase